VNILLLQLKRIGDLVLTTPLIAALREKFPDAVITLIISRENAALLPAITGVDRSFVIQRKLSDVKIFRAVSREEFDYCIDLTGNDRSALLAYLSCAQERIASNWNQPGELGVVLEHTDGQRVEAVGPFKEALCRAALKAVE